MSSSLCDANERTVISDKNYLIRGPNLLLNTPVTARWKWPITAYSDTVTENRQSFSNLTDSILFVLFATVNSHVYHFKQAFDIYIYTVSLLFLIAVHVMSTRASRQRRKAEINSNRVELGIINNTGRTFWELAGFPCHVECTESDPQR